MKGGDGCGIDSKSRGSDGSCCGSGGRGSGLMSGGSAAAYEGGKIHLLFPQRAISQGRLS